MTLLLTGYEPFDEYETNPSARAARRLDGATVAGHDVVGRVLPVEYDGVGDRVAGLVAEHDPVAVVGTGLAPGRAAVCVERVGVNVADCAGVPDNAGHDPRNEPLDPDGADARLATLPVVAVVEALLAAEVPARVSNTAGTHLCNGLLYETLALLDRTGRSVPAGFLHFPFAPAGAARQAREGEAASGGAVPPSLPLDLAVAAAEVTFEVAAGA